jgi:hypothetical protein
METGACAVAAYAPILAQCRRKRKRKRFIPIRFEFPVSRPCGASTVLYFLVEALEQEQKTRLLDGVKRVLQATGPELVPDGIDGGTQIGIDQHRLQNLDLR